MSAAPSNPAPRKRGSACTRCRLQKVRCGKEQPTCSNCVKAGVACVKAGPDESSRQYIEQLEKRTRWLEDVLRQVAPGTLEQGLQVPLAQSADPPDLESGPDADTNTLCDTSQSMMHPTSGDTSVLSTGSNKQQQPPSSCYSQQPVLTSISPPNAHSLVDPRKSGLTHTESPSEIGPNQPLAHDVGLLSLANSTEPKYLGPSSGVTFARLIFAAAPQSQGLSSTSAVHALEREQCEHSSNVLSQPPSANIVAELPEEAELHYFVDAYYETWHPLYPFLDEELCQELVSRVQAHSQLQNSHISTIKAHSVSQSLDTAQLFLVIALGAKVLESRLSTNFSSDSYYATAMVHVGKLQLHDSMRGVQVLLLLVLSSFSFTYGLNAWFLTSTIIASCLDLGLQRKYIEARLPAATPEAEDEVRQVKQQRCTIFWSAYSLDRTLCVILGRPLTLRDEAIDIEYPGEWKNTEIDQNAIPQRNSQDHPRKRVCLDRSPYMVSIYSFRFDRITAEIKLMLYRVAQSPSRFPWPTNLNEWQIETYDACKELLEEARQDLKWRGHAVRNGPGIHDGAIRLIELKFHHCAMILNRPSPAIPQPSSSALMKCYESATSTVRIQAELAKFANMTNSWLTAHALFVSGITMLYCIWTSPEVRKSTNMTGFFQQADACTKVLEILGKTWPVAKSAQVKFHQLVQLTKDSWKSKLETITPVQNEEAMAKDTNENQPGMNTQVRPVENYAGQPGLENLQSNFWDEVNPDFAIAPNMLIDELGDVGQWFDLDWLGDANLGFGMDNSSHSAY